jgi:outer membrane protein TolC
MSHRVQTRSCFGWVGCLASAAFCLLLSSSEAAASPLLLSEVLTSVQKLYPPYLAILLEQDLANARAQQALGAFDLQLNAGSNSNPIGYYNGRTSNATLDQPLPFWGGNVYGGYRLSSGFLPDYNKERTGTEGSGVVGLKIPLLRDGSIDRRRATLWQARIDKELADPIILRQYLDFIRAATISYYNWVAAGQRLALAEELLRLAKDRDSAIQEQVRTGASAPIIQIDNLRLVVSREIGVVQANRRFQAAAIELSLFYRKNVNSEPILASRDQLPNTFPPRPRPSENRIDTDLPKALTARPEMRRIALSMEKLRIDQRLAKNNLLPNLDIALEGSQVPDGKPASKTERTELTAKVELKVPLQRREAKGRLESFNVQISRLEQEQTFARDRITADVRDSLSALFAAYYALAQSHRNVDLAQKVQDAENEKLKQGASDLLALQIREQATFDAKVLEVEALADYFRADANYRAATAADAAIKKAQ